ncbi:MAG: T9SS type A sorting domain-containing protein [Candidatus Pseudobacter hemicellulosilyticus]|uniref:T9SS type A sorting domain-containing protein n=1 Tax=Candidatus Pseudobacter hemicellulosilyticus TaxID=3121375 RepID=A0AAJ5WTN8_9BACT|nr:MAG: T9SS type A sorting domain-containing protein [Pseudobacter sp.]
MNPYTFMVRSSLLLLITLLTTSSLWAQAPDINVAFGVIKFGNSYVNVSKKTAGGTVEPGDTLEIRTCYWLPNNYLNNANYYLVRFLSNIPTNTVFLSDPGIQQITNEGVLYKQYTSANNDDAASYVASPATGAYNVRMNLGNSASKVTVNTNAANGGGQVVGGTNKPKLNSGTLITTAFQVKVTGAVGQNITLGAAQLRFRKTNSTSTATSDYVIKHTQYQIMITDNAPICADAVGANIVEEGGGTFDSGSVQNRAPRSTDYTLAGNVRKNLAVGSEIDDGYYTIVNNLSPRASIIPGARKQPDCNVPASLPTTDPLNCNNRMFGGHWDIIGDHTGSATPAGNLPPAAGGQGGYMLVVNAEYATIEAYKQSITGLCPNTSYEFSFWIRNVCTNCGIDSNSTQTWKPGVLPNLTVALDGMDRYSTGQVDTVGWVKKGFMFKTGATQTSIDISVRNNASGGGGNDWALDDIFLRTCNPNLTMMPSTLTTICDGDQVNLSCVVKSFFDNYINYTWELSTDNGLNWAPTGHSGAGIPTKNATGEYEYQAFFPSFLGNTAMDGHRYRFRVASTSNNLTDADCSFLNTTTIAVNVEYCHVLSTKVVGFAGTLVNRLSRLEWAVKNESTGTVYEVERSTDGTSFSRIGSVSGKAAANGAASYTLTDNTPVNGAVYYRLRITEPGTQQQFSKTVLLSNSDLELALLKLVNPFTQTLSFDLVSPAKGTTVISLTDMVGRRVKQLSTPVTRGLNSIKLHHLEGLANGIYHLRVEMNGQAINRQVVKAGR